MVFTMVKSPDLGGGGGGGGGLHLPLIGALVRVLLWLAVYKSVTVHRYMYIVAVLTQLWCVSVSSRNIIAFLVT